MADLAKKKTCRCCCGGNGVQAATGGASEGGLNRNGERHRIIESFDVLSVPKDVQALIVEALDSREWDWFKDCDGCTAVSEAYWPTKYFPPCLRHDFDWATGRGGLEANIRFYKIQRAYRMSALQSGIRFIGVTASWFAWFKWRR